MSAPKRATCTQCRNTKVPPNTYVCTPCCREAGYVTEAITTRCMDCQNRAPVTHHAWADGVTCLPCLAVEAARSAEPTLFQELSAHPGRAKCHTCPGEAEEDYAGFCTECWWEDRPQRDAHPPASRGGGYRAPSQWKLPEPKPEPVVPTAEKELEYHPYRAPRAT